MQEIKKALAVIRSAVNLGERLQTKRDILLRHFFKASLKQKYVTMIIDLCTLRTCSPPPIL